MAATCKAVQQMLNWARVKAEWNTKPYHTYHGSHGMPSDIHILLEQVVVGVD
jgi:hypothetical protein